MASAESLRETGVPESPGAASLVVVGLGFALVLSVLTGASPRAALLGLGGLGGLVGLCALLAVSAHRVTDLCFVAFFFVVTVPVDKYFGYQAHVGGWPGIRVSIGDLVLLVLGSIAVVAWLLGRGRRALPGPLLVLLALTLVQYGVSMIGSPRRDLSLFESIATVHALAVAWVIAATFRRGLIEAVLVALSLQVVVHTGFAVAQVATGRPIGAGLFGGPQTVLTETVASGAAFLRPSGLFVHPIVYADFLFLSLPLVAAGAFFTGRRWLRVLEFVTLAIGLTGLALTLSRGAWFAGMVAAAALVFFGLRRGFLDRAHLRVALRVGAAGALAILIAFGPRIYDRLTMSNAGNLDVRFDLNRIALRMIAASPITGHGLNTFTEVMARYDPKDVMAYFPAPAHNLYLLEAAETGLPGLALLLGVFATILIAGTRGLARTRDPALAWIAAAVLAGFWGLLVSQFADFSLRLEPLRSFVWALIGLLFGVLRESRTTTVTTTIARPVAARNEETNR